MKHFAALLPLMALAILLPQPADAQTNRVVVPDPQDWVMKGHGNFAGQLERPLRYTPVERDFVITNGAEFFNRPLYGMNTPFRVDAGDKPEFSLYLPGRGGNLRLGIKTELGVKWLNDADQIVTRYRAGAMVYEIKDALMMDIRELRVTVLPLGNAKGIIVRAEINSAWMPIELVWAFGGATIDYCKIK